MAIQVLVDSFGHPHLTWDVKVEKFRKECDKPSIWTDLSHPQRPTIIAMSLEFIREANKLAEEHKELENTIYSQQTLKAIMSVLPPSMVLKLAEITGRKKLLAKDEL